MFALKFTMLTGHAYAYALRADMLSAAAVFFRRFFVRQTVWMVWTWIDSTPYTRCYSNRDTAKRLYSLSMISCESHKYWLILGRIFLQPVEMGSYALSTWIWCVSCCYSSLLSAMVIGHYICSVLHASFWRTYCTSQINKAIPGTDEKCALNNGQRPICEVYNMWVLDHQKEPQVLVWWFYWPDNRASVDANV